MAELTPAAARAALREMRSGNPPDEAIADWLAAGDPEPMQRAAKLMAQAIRGSYETLLVAGAPGAGKSHLVRRVQHHAFAQGLVVSAVSQNVAEGISLSRADMLYRAIIDNLRASGQEFDVTQAIVQAWTRVAVPVVSSRKMNMGQYYVLRDAGLLPEDCPPRTTLALLTYLWAQRLGDSAAAQVALSVIRGEPVTNTLLIANAIRVGISPGYIGYTPNHSSYWLSQLRVLAFLAVIAGWKATVVVLDEIESVSELINVRSRSKAFAVLEALLTNEPEFDHLLWVFAYTPDFLVRLQQDAATTIEFRRAFATLRRERESDLTMRLSIDEAMTLVAKVRQLFVTATDYGGSFPQSGQLVAKWHRSGANTRELVRGAIDECDRARAGERGSSTRLIDPIPSEPQDVTPRRRSLSVRAETDAETFGNGPTLSLSRSEVQAVVTNGRRAVQVAVDRGLLEWLPDRLTKRYALLVAFGGVARPVTNEQCRDLAGVVHGIIHRRGDWDWSSLRQEGRYLNIRWATDPNSESNPNRGYVVQHGEFFVCPLWSALNGGRI